MPEELQALRDDLASYEEQVSKINEEKAEVTAILNDAKVAVNELGAKAKALAESTRVPLARIQGLRSKIARLEAEYENESPPDPPDDNEGQDQATEGQDPE